MKTKTLRDLLGCMMALCLSACQEEVNIVLFSGDEVNNEAGTCTNLLSSAILYLNGQTTEEIGIANGKGGYSAQSSDESIVTATVNNGRLFINAVGKKGEAKVTVCDKKGNSVFLPVTVAYGGVNLYCVKTGIAVSVGNEILSVEKEENKALLEEVDEVMRQHYSLVAPQDICVLQPEDIRRRWQDGDCGSFTLLQSDTQASISGTYRVGHDEELMTGKQERTITFCYKGRDNAEKIHKFYLEPSLSRQPSTRELGPVMTVWLEEVTDIPCLSGIVLPEQAKVFYGVVVETWSRISLL